MRFSHVHKSSQKGLLKQWKHQLKNEEHIFSSCSFGHIMVEAIAEFWESKNPTRSKQGTTTCAFLLRLAGVQASATLVPSPNLNLQWVRRRRLRPWHMERDPWISPCGHLALVASQYSRRYYCDREAPRTSPIITATNQQSGSLTSRSFSLPPLFPASGRKTWYLKSKPKLAGTRDRPQNTLTRITPS